MFCVHVHAGSVVDSKRIEICFWETRSVICSDEGKIIILSSTYGHMAETRCYNTKNESNKCSVHSYVKAKCHEKIACLIELPDKELDAMPNCSNLDIKNLEIVYQCKNGKYFLIIACYV